MKKFVSTALAVLLAIGTLTACSSNSSGTQAPGDSGNKTVKIGVCMPMTGQNAIAGEYAKMGLELALKEVKDAGGVDIGGEKYDVELIYEDNEAKPEITVNAYNKLIGQDGVVAIIGPDQSKCIISAGPIAQSAKIPCIGTTTSNVTVTDVGDYVFRACFIDDFQGLVCARLALEELKASKAAVLYSNADDYAVGLEKAFEDAYTQMGGELVAKEAYAGADVKDFNAQLTNIKKSGAQVLFMPSQAGELPLQIKQAKAMGLDMQLMGEMSWDNPVIPELAGNENIEGSLFVSVFAPDNPDPMAQDYVKKFQEMYEGTLPNTQATASYECFRIIMDSLQRAGKVDGEALRNAMAQTKELQLPTGLLTFDEKRNPQKSANIMEYVDGKPKFKTVINP